METVYQGEVIGYTWGTADGETLEDTFIIYARGDRYSSGAQTMCTGWTTKSDFTNNMGTVLSTPGSFNYDTTSEHILVQGEPYLLTPPATDIDAIDVADVRMYPVGNGEYINLASFYRESKQEFEYICFTPGGVEQYNDDDAKYERLKHTKHTLPIEYEGIPLFGNGEFSLVATQDMQAYEDPIVVEYEERF